MTERVKLKFEEMVGFDGKRLVELESEIRGDLLELRAEIYGKGLAKSARTDRQKLRKNLARVLFLRAKMNKEATSGTRS